MELMSYADAAPPIPAEFYRFRFTTNARSQIQDIVEWVYMVKGIPDTIKNLAAKYTMAANQGRGMYTEHLDVGYGDDAKEAGLLGWDPIKGRWTGSVAEHAVDVSIKLYITELKSFIPKITNNVLSRMKFWIDTWLEAQATKNRFRGSDFDSNRSLIAEMSTPQRFKMVAEHISREFEIELTQIAKKYPTVEIYEGYLNTALTGQSSTGMNSMGGAAQRLV